MAAGLVQELLESCYLVNPSVGQSDTTHLPVKSVTERLRREELGLSSSTESGLSNTTPPQQADGPVLTPEQGAQPCTGSSTPKPARSDKVKSIPRSRTVNYLFSGEVAARSW